jgi:two-component system, NtrC family, sensor histidine kinase PilS
MREGPRAQIADSYWHSLKYLAVARLLIAGVMTVFLPTYVKRVEGALLQDSTRFFFIAGLYVLVAAVLLVLIPRFKPRFLSQLLVHVTVDLIFVGLLVFTAGGPRSGFAILFVAPAAGAAILAPLMWALLVAAIATITLLCQSLYGWLTNEGVEPSFFAAAMTGFALFGVVIALNRLALRLASEEARAKRRGEDLRNQLAVNQLVIAELTDGVVIFSATGIARVMNRAALQMIGGPQNVLAIQPAMGTTLSGMTPSGPSWEVVIEQFVLWRDAGRSNASSLDVNLLHPASANQPGVSKRVRLRFLGVPVASQDTSDVVLVMEDLDRIESEAQQLKLAAMGRLSASIAHEIRNPLGAIRHANSLLTEALAPEAVPSRMRLSKIVEDNSVRINRIIEDILAIARRERAAVEPIDPAVFFEDFLPDFVAQHQIAGSKIDLQIVSTRSMLFDQDHLRQILVNLLLNAIRYSSDNPGSVCIEWRSGAEDRLELCVFDDGPGIPTDLLRHLFEPFMTSEARGTGLGLYLARELCHSNDSTIRYFSPSAQRPLGGFVISTPIS